MTQANPHFTPLQIVSLGVQLPNGLPIHGSLPKLVGVVIKLNTRMLSARRSRLRRRHRQRHRARHRGQRRRNSHYMAKGYAPQPTANGRIIIPKCGADWTLLGVRSCAHNTNGAILWPLGITTRSARMETDVHCTFIQIMYRWARTPFQIFLARVVDLHTMFIQRIQYFLTGTSLAPTVTHVNASSETHTRH